MLNLKAIALGAMLSVVPMTSFAQQTSQAQSNSNIIIEEEPWTQAKLITVTAGAIMGGWLSFMIADAIFVETTTVEMGQLVVSDTAEHTGIKGFFVMIGAPMTGYGAAKLFDNFSGEITNITDHITSTISYSVNSGYSAGEWAYDSVLDTYSLITAKAYEIYDNVKLNIVSQQ